MLVAELAASFGFTIDKRSIASVQRSIAGVRSMLLGLGTAVLGGSVLRSLVRLNAESETLRNQIAGVLALSKGSNLSDELQTANDAIAELRKRAAGLPGTAADYVRFMSRVTQQATKAGLSVAQILDMSTSGVVAAKALGVQWQTAARDIDQALQGRLSIRDELTSKLLATVGYDGEDGRKRFNRSSAGQRAALLMQAMSSRQITQLAQQQANSVTGRLERLQDQAQLFAMRVGGPLFRALGEALERVNTFLDEHRAKLAAIADAIGGFVSGAFARLRDLVSWLMEHGDVARGLLWGIAAALGVTALNAAIAAAPVIFLVGRLAALGTLFETLRDKIGDVGAVLLTAFGAALLFRFTAVANGIKAITSALLGMRAQAALSQGALALNPMGAPLGGAAVAARVGAKGVMGAMGLAGSIGAPVLGALAANELMPGSTAYDDAMERNMRAGRHVWDSRGFNNNVTNVTVGDSHVTVNVSGGDVSDPAALKQTVEEAIADSDRRRMRETIDAFDGGRRPR